MYITQKQLLLEDEFALKAENLNQMFESPYSIISTVLWKVVYQHFKKKLFGRKLLIAKDPYRYIILTPFKTC